MRKLTEKRIRQLFWVIPLAFYISTMAKTMGYVDASLILNNAYELQISAWVNNHNLFSLLGWIWIRIFPVGSEFVRINLLAAAFGAFTVYFIFLTCFEYTKKISISLITAIALMLSHSLWWHSNMIEVYTLNTFLIALILYSVLKYFRTSEKKWIFASMFFWGLGISNHILMSLFVIAFIVLLIIKRKSYSIWDVAKGVAFLILGLSLFLFACLKSYLSYHSVIVVINQLTGGEFRSLMFSSAPRLFWWLNYLGLIIYQYPSLILIFLFCGLYALFVRRESFDLFLIAALIPQILWSANYYVWDMYAFSLPVYVLLSVVICKGLSLINPGRKVLIITSISLLLPIFLYKNIHRITFVRRFVERYPMIEMVQGIFDPVKYFLDPEKHAFNRADKFIKTLFRRLPENAWYFGNTYDYPIRYYYQPIRHLRLDIRSPIIFTFWTTEEEKIKVSKQVNALIVRKEPVFISGYILDLLNSRLVYRGIKTIKINETLIFQLY